MTPSEQFASPGSASLTPDDRIDLICDAFEHAWLTDEVPKVEEFLERAISADREGLLKELLLVDREYRIRKGEHVSREEYRQRFPEFAAVIDALDFATIDDRGGRRADTLRMPRAALIGGSRLAQFELLEELGTGAFGTVWKAHDTRLRRLVAIKLPRQEELSDVERDRFVREGQACAQLRHPNIVAVYEVGEDDGRAFIVTEFVDGVNLRKWLSDHRPTPKESAELIALLAEALHHAHELGVIHRDLKPANVLMDRDERPHITDFGLAKWTADSGRFTVEGNVLGTPAYMSPEQARGDVTHIDRRSDVYGLGALLYELLAGQAPFDGDVASIIHQAIHNEPAAPRKINASIPHDLETVCLKGMQKDPRGRYPSAQELAVDLRRYLRGDPILARRMGPLAKTWRLIRRRPAAAALLILAPVLLIASMSIASLMKKNYDLQGYRKIRISTEPEGARVALVPIDERTGEPNPDPAGIVRPGGLTPLETLAKSGNYLLEAAIQHDDGTADFVELRVTVPPKKLPRPATKRKNQARESEEDVAGIDGIEIKRTADVIADMVAVPIDEELRRKNPLLPALIYVDPDETTSSLTSVPDASATALSVATNEDHIQFRAAKYWAAYHGKRIASEGEYDAITEIAKSHNLTLADSTTSAAINGLSNDVAEWTTTKYRFLGQGDRDSTEILRDMIVLKAFGDIGPEPAFMRSPEGKLIALPNAASSHIGWRGVRSGAPRFVKP